MKKIFLSIIIFIISFSVKGQFPSFPYNGNSSTGFGQNSAISSKIGFLWYTSFADTTALNNFSVSGASAGFLKNIAGFTARVVDDWYMRSNDLQSWVKMNGSGGGGSGWNLPGNAGTTAGTNFLGTTDSVGFMIKANNIQSGYIDLRKTSTSLGYYSLNSNTIGTGNEAFGARSLMANTVGNGNQAFGTNTLTANLSGSGNVAIGSDVLSSNTTGQNNAGLGTGVLASNNGDENTFLGANAGISNTSSNNSIGIGFLAGGYSDYSNRLYINSLNRSDIAGDTTQSIIYGVQDPTADSQRLYLNAKVYAPYITSGIPNGAKRVLWGNDNQFYASDTVATSGGSQTFQQTLTTGSTLTGDNTVTNTGHTFKISNTTERLSLGDSSVFIGNERAHVKTNNVGNKLHIYTPETTTDVSTYDLLVGKPSDGESAYMDYTALPFVPVSDSATIANPTGYVMGKDIVGDWISTTFPSLPAGWSNYLVSPSFSGGMVVAAGGGATVCTNGFTYNTKYSNSLNYTTTMDFTFQIKLQYSLTPTL